MKNTQVVLGKGENLDMLLGNMSKWDINAVTVGCILAVNWKVIKEFHGVRKVVGFGLGENILFICKTNTTWLINFMVQY